MDVLGNQYIALHGGRGGGGGGGVQLILVHNVRRVGVGGQSILSSGGDNISCPGDNVS